MTFGCLEAAWGKAFKLSNLKTTFILSVLIFEVGSLICDIQPNDPALIVGWAIAGVGGAGISVGTPAQSPSAPSQKCGDTDGLHWADV